MQCQQQLNIITSMEYSHHKLPAFLRSYFLNGVTTLLDTKEEVDIVNKFLVKNKLGECIDVIPNHEIIMQSHELPELIVDCVTATFIFKTLE